MAKPKLCLIPASQGSKVFSVLPSDGSGDFDFSRSGSATRINSQGLIETVSNGQSRLNYPMIDGKVVGCPSLLLEPQSTNLVTYSENFSDSSWIKSRSTYTSDAIKSPSGLINMGYLTENTASGNTHYMRTFLTLTDGIYYTLSVFAKAKERNIICLGDNAASQSNTGVWFDLTNGVILTQRSGYVGNIKDFGNGIYRCSVIYSASASRQYADIALSLSDGVNVYTGDGTSGVYIWGAQVEQQSYPTSYIPNFGTALGVTRSAETCNNAGDADTFNDSEGVLMAEISALADDGTFRQIGLSGTSGNEVNLSYDSVSNRIGGIVRSSGTYYVLSHIVSDTTSITKVAIKYKVNDISLYVNGLEVDSKSTAVMPSSLNSFDFSVGFTKANKFYGKTKQLQYFDTALTDTDLEELTSWTSFNEMATAQLYSVY